MRPLKQTTYTLILIGLIMFISTQTLYAGLSVKPERHVLNLSPNEEEIIEYEIYNSGPKDINIKVETKHWTELKGQKDIVISSWLIPQEDVFDIQAGETKKLKIKTKAPEGVKGEIVAMIFFCYKETEASSLNIRNGNPLYMVIKGTEEYKAEIKAVNLKLFRDKKRNNKQCFQVTVNMNNTGNIHFKPEIDVFIADKHGRLIKKLNLKNTWPILRNKNYKYSLKWWKPEFKRGETYRVVVNVNYKDKLKDISMAKEFRVIDEKIIAVDKKDA